MTEQAVKDAKVKRDAAQADLDKAVADAKDEVSKTTAAIEDAAPETKTVDPHKPAPEPVEPPKAAPVPVHQAPSLYPPTAPSSIWPKVAAVVAVVLGGLAIAHWGFKLF